MGESLSGMMRCLRSLISSLRVRAGSVIYLAYGSALGALLFSVFLAVISAQLVFASASAPLLGSKRGILIMDELGGPDEADGKGFQVGI